MRLEGKATGQEGPPLTEAIKQVVSGCFRASCDVCGARAGRRARAFEHFRNLKAPEPQNS